MANQAYERIGPLPLPRNWVGQKEQLRFDEIIVELFPDRVVVTPVDTLGRRQTTLGQSWPRDKSSNSG